MRPVASPEKACGLTLIKDAKILILLLILRGASRTARRRLDLTNDIVLLTVHKTDLAASRLVAHAQDPLY